MADRTAAPDPEDFSLVLGGPLYQLLLRARLARPSLDLLSRRIVASLLPAWLPLLVISLLEGRAFGGVRIPFLMDLEVQIRFLVALPLLILAERIIHERLRPAVRLFVEKGIVRPEDRPRFDEIVSSTMRWRNSLVVELLLAFVFTGGHTLPKPSLSTKRSGSSDRRTLDPLCRARASGMPGSACRSSSSSCCVGGTGSSSGAASCSACPAWTSICLPPIPTVRVASDSWARVRLRSLPFSWPRARSCRPWSPAGSFKKARSSRISSSSSGGFSRSRCSRLGPLMVFAPNLLAAKRRGLREYGLLANRYVKEFDRKWIHGGAAPDELLVGSADLQSLADLDGSFAVVRGMRLFPFGRETVTQLVATVVLPGLPLVLTVIPLEELVKRLLGALL